MDEMKLAQKNREDIVAWNNLYANLVEFEIRKIYSVSNELAILRQRDTKPDEFEEYNNTVEAIKAQVKKDMEW